MEAEKLLAIQTLRSVLKDGYYDAQIVWLSSYKISTDGQRSYFHPPFDWSREIQEKSGGHVVVLKTVTGDLILLHPDTYNKVMGSIEAMIRNKRVEVKTPHRRKESPLWPILRKFRGAWASAKKRKKRGSKELRRVVTVGADLLPALKGEASSPQRR